eukprot:1790997-Heterocapsa_arctica.AAC.1
MGEHCRADGPVGLGDSVSAPGRAIHQRKNWKPKGHEGGGAKLICAEGCKARRRATIAREATPNHLELASRTRQYS